MRRLLITGPLALVIVGAKRSFDFPLLFGNSAPSYSGLQFGWPMSLNAGELLLIKSCAGVHQFMVLTWLKITVNCIPVVCSSGKKSLIAYQKG